MINDIPTGHKKATRSALNILDYADNTEKKLREKLFRKGYSEDEVDFAVEYAKRKGYLNDRRLAENAMERIANAKLYGKQRIVQELYNKGVSRDIISELDFSEIDFARNCAKRILQTKNRYADREKLNAALLRYGFRYSDIKAAYSIIEEEYEEDE